jgi:hypothetical protein
MILKRIQNSKVIKLRGERLLIDFGADFTQRWAMIFDDRLELCHTLAAGRTYDFASRSSVS